MPASAEEAPHPASADPELMVIPRSVLPAVVAGQEVRAVSRDRGPILYRATNSPRPLPSVFATDFLPSRAELTPLIERISCPSCGGAQGIASFESGVAVAAYLVRCRKCVRWYVGFVSTHTHVDPGNVVVAFGNPKSAEYRSQLGDGTKCRVCGEPNQDPGLALETFRYKTLLPFLIHCTKCDVRPICVAFVQEPRRYAEHNIQIARQIVERSPAAAYAFCVAALEAFLLRAYVLDSDTRFQEVFGSKFSFQRLSDANRKFKTSTDHSFNLFDLAGQKRWQFLLDAVEKRHFIVHNAGLDAALNSVVVTDADVIELEREALAFIDAVDGACKNRCLY
jgi:hypothetical protein